MNPVRYSRIFSIDPGLKNIGLAILDSQWRIMELRNTTLPGGAAQMREQLITNPSGFLQYQTAELELWINRYIFPRLPMDESPVLVIVEENSDKLKYTKDWTGIIGGLFHWYEFVDYRVVLPKRVCQWLVRTKKMPSNRQGRDRNSKKDFTINLVSQLELSPGAIVPDQPDEHSSDAAINAMYYRELFIDYKKY